MSKYEAKVIELKPDIIRKHANADSLHIVDIPGTCYTCCIRSDDWMEPDGTLKSQFAAYIEPDTLVNTDREEFKWLKGTTGKLNEPVEYRVRAKKLRGVNSFGFLIPTKLSAGTDVWDEWGLKRWQPPEPSGDNSQSVKAPQRDFSQYDVENLKKYVKVFEGKNVVGTLKIHGQNMRVCYQNGQMYVGSRAFWKADFLGSDFWKSYYSVPGLESLAKENNHLCIYGESYGNTKLREDCVNPGERRFRAFDIFDMNRNIWLDIGNMHNLCTKYDVPFCPIIYKGVFDINKLLELAEQDSPLCKGQMSEGVVVVTEKEEWHEKLGRCKAKIVSCRYLDKGE